MGTTSFGTSAQDTGRLDEPAVFDATSEIAITDSQEGEVLCAVEPSEQSLHISWERSIPAIEITGLASGDWVYDVEYKLQLGQRTIEWSGDSHAPDGGASWTTAAATPPSDKVADWPTEYYALLTARVIVVGMESGRTHEQSSGEVHVMLNTNGRFAPALSNAELHDVIIAGDAPSPEYEVIDLGDGEVAVVMHVTPPDWD